VVFWVVCHVGCCGMSVQGGRLGVLVSFVGVVGSLMFGDVRITGREEVVRHVMPIQSCIFEEMCNDGRSHGQDGVQGRIIEAYVGGFAKQELLLEGTECITFKHEFDTRLEVV
jgi:hypothetical protein